MLLQVPVRTKVTALRFEQTNEAPEALRSGQLEGAGVLLIDEQTRKREARGD